MRRTKFLVFLTFFIVLAVSCETQNSLYSWYDYPEKYYRYVKNGDEKSVNELIEAYEKIITRQKGSRNTVPPGIYADYGLLLVEGGKKQEGIKMLRMEKQLYPESSVFINNFLKRFEQ